MYCRTAALLNQSEDSQQWLICIPLLPGSVRKILKGAHCMGLCLVQATPWTRSWVSCQQNHWQESRFWVWALYLRSVQQQWGVQLLQLPQIPLWRQA